MATFGDLSPEVILNIFSFLDSRTVALLCAGVCREWRSLALVALRDSPSALHEDFLLSRTSLWVDENGYLKEIDEHIESFITPLVVTGEPGCGKSALMANWIARRAQRHPKDLLLYHFVESSPQSTDHHNLLHRFMRILKTTGMIMEDIPSAFANLQPKFQQWLQIVSQTRQIVIAIDGLDLIQNEDGAHTLNWLPLNFPQNIKLIVSSQKGALLETCLKKKKWAELRMRPFSKKEKSSLIQRFIRSNSSFFTPQHLEKIITAPQTQNPLYLCVLLKNLALFDSPASFEKSLSKFLLTKNAIELFMQIVACIQGVVDEEKGTSHVRDLLSFISVSKNGLSEREICDILKLDDETWRLLSWWLQPCLVVKSGLLNISHDAFGEAIGSMFFRKPGSYEKICSRLAQYFYNQLEGSEISPRVTEELPWLLEKSNNMVQLKACLSNIYLFEKLFENESKYDLFCYWISVGSPSEEIANIYQQALSEYEKSPHSSCERVAHFSHKIGEYMRDSGYYKEAISFFNKALEIRQTVYGEVSPEVALTMNELGRLYFRLGKNKETLTMWETAYQIRKEIKEGKQDHEIAISMNNLGLIYDKLGREKEAETAYQTSLEIYLRVAGPNHPDVSITYHNLGLLYASRSHTLAKSEEMYLKALSIKESYYGKNHNELAMTLNNLALVYSKMYMFEKACKLYNKALAIKEEFFGGEHPDVALFLFNLGACYAKMQQRDLAKKCLLRSLRIRKRIHGPHDEATLAVRSWVLFYGWDEDEE